MIEFWSKFIFFLKFKMQTLSMEYEIREIYKNSCLIDGEIEDYKLLFNHSKRKYNNSIKFINYFFVLIHLIVFIFDDPILSDNLIYWKISEGIGSRYLNLCI